MNKQSCLEKNTCYIRLLNTLNPSSRKTLIRKASKAEIDTISEIANNILLGNISQNPLTIRKFKKFKSLLRNIADKKNSRRKKIRMIVTPRGGTLLGLILKTIANFL